MPNFSSTFINTKCPDNIVAMALEQLKTKITHIWTIFNSVNHFLKAYFGSMQGHASLTRLCIPVWPADTIGIKCQSSCFLWWHISQFCSWGEKAKSLLELPFLLHNSASETAAVTVRLSADKSRAAACSTCHAPGWPVRSQRSSATPFDLEPYRLSWLLWLLCFISNSRLTGRFMDCTKTAPFSIMVHGLSWFPFFIP